MQCSLFAWKHTGRVLRVTIVDLLLLKSEASLLSSGNEQQPKLKAFAVGKEWRLRINTARENNHEVRIQCLRTTSILRFVTVVRTHLHMTRHLHEIG